MIRSDSKKRNTLGAKSQSLKPGSSAASSIKITQICLDNRLDP